jgi:hypothetical protein
MNYLHENFVRREALGKGQAVSAEKAVRRIICGSERASERYRSRKLQFEG